MRERRAWWRCWSHRAGHTTDMPATREAEARALQLKASLGNSVGLVIPLPLRKKGWGLALECLPGMDEVLLSPTPKTMKESRQMYNNAIGGAMPAHSRQPTDEQK